MRVIIRILRESIELTIAELWNNKLRSFLSLLGITIGIFCIILVFASVDSLERNVRDSINQMGDKVLYVEKWPWAFGSEYPWWKYISRPEANYKDYKAILKQADDAEVIAMQFILAGKLLKYKNNTVNDAMLVAVTHDYNKIYEIKIDQGRYFTKGESRRGDNLAIIGSGIAESLFDPGIDPVGKAIKISGRKVVIVAVMKKEGESLLNWNLDNAVILPYHYMLQFVNNKNPAFAQRIIVKAKEQVSLVKLKDQLTRILRNVRRLNPGEESNFAMNQVSILTQGLDQTFSLINFAGLFIGGFAILVGGFGIANIMFVSVRERTSIIGIKKSLGARKIFILLEFLIESVMLCLIGGLIGLFLVFGAIRIGNQFSNFQFVLSGTNIMVGITTSLVIGILSGFIPALMASKMDPVEAIRTH